MTGFPLTIAMGDYDRTRALVDGTVRPDGIDLTCVLMEPGDLFARVARDREFPAAEFSLSTYLNFRARDDHRLMAIPVFPSRMFRHGYIWVNRHAGIATPSDLRGRRVGTIQYQVTSNLWTRGFLRDDHGIVPQDFTWVFGGTDEPGEHERAPVAIPAGVHVEAAPPDRSLGEMLAAGDIDALFVPHLPRVVAEGDPNIVRLFPDFRTVETDYYRRTSLFPIMHVVVLREDVLRAEPWVARSLFDAFCAAKAHALRRLRSTGTLAVMLPWMVEELEAAQALFGAKYWPYGVADNRAELDAAVRYASEQGIAVRDLDVGELFVPDTYELIDPGA